MCALLYSRTHIIAGEFAGPGYCAAIAYICCVLMCILSENINHFHGSNAMAAVWLLLTTFISILGEIFPLHGVIKNIYGSYSNKQLYTKRCYTLVLCTLVVMYA